MSTINIIGSLIEDTIWEDGKKITKLGGIANLWHEFKKRYPEHEINVLPVQLGEALITVNTATGSRVNRCVPNIRTIPMRRYPEADWTHVAYLNGLPSNISRDLESGELLKQTGGHLSVDTAYGIVPENHLEKIKNVHYVLGSQEEFPLDSLYMTGDTCLGAAIVHDKSCSIWSEGRDPETVKHHEQLDNLNVLGAGDKWAVYWIDSMLATDCDVSKSLQQAHERFVYYHSEEKV